MGEGLSQVRAPGIGGGVVTVVPTGAGSVPRATLGPSAQARIYGLSATAGTRPVQAVGYVLVTPSGQAAMLRDQSSRIISTLNNSGSSADRVYIQSQVDVHQGLLTMLDSQLIPSAHNDLLNMLQKQRSTVAAHLDRARQILATMP